MSLKDSSIKGFLVKLLLSQFILACFFGSADDKTSQQRRLFASQAKSLGSF